MALNINNRIALGNIKDLTTPSSTAQYKLGTIIEVEDTTLKSIKRYIYVKSHTSLTAYQPYIVGNSATAGSEVITAAPATLAAPGSLVCVPQVAFTSGYYGFVQIEGTATALMTAETYAVGDTLQILNTGTAFVVDGSTGSPATTVNTSAICKEAGTTAVARSIYLIGRPAVVAAT
jgi:hypothetical protein